MTQNQNQGRIYRSTNKSAARETGFAKSLKMGGNKNLRSLRRELGQKATQAAAREATSPPPILNVPSFPSNLN